MDGDDSVPGTMQLQGGVFLMERADNRFSRRQRAQDIEDIEDVEDDNVSFQEKKMSSLLVREHALNRKVHIMDDSSTPSDKTGSVHISKKLFSSSKEDLDLWNSSPIEVLSLPARNNPPSLSSKTVDRYGHVRDLSILHVAEKPSIALSLSKAFSSQYSENNCSRKADMGIEKSNENENDTNINEKSSKHETFDISTLSFPPPVPVHSVRGQFQSHPCQHIITSVTGHVYSTDFVTGYEDWDKIDPVSLFGAKTVKVPAGGQSIPRHLQSVAEKSHIVILWLDCDNEGENICFEVLHNVVPWLQPIPLTIQQKHQKQIQNQQNQHQHGRKPIEPLKQVYRSKFSQLSPQALLTAYRSSLVDPDIRLSLAVDARQEFDLKVGAAFTRFQTLFFRSKYSDLGAKLLSYGPCLTPTLAFCVSRNDERALFQPEPFWTLVGQVEIDIDFLPNDKANNGPVQVLNKQNIESDDKYVFHLSWSRGRLFSEPVAKILLEKCRQQPKTIASNLTKDSIFGTAYTIQREVSHSESVMARVSRVLPKVCHKSPPLALNTIQLLKLSSQRLGLSPKSAMQIAEGLYLRGFISYPRTETTRYGSDFRPGQELAAFTTHPDPLWSNYAKKTMKLYGKPGTTTDLWKGSGIDAGDHPPITPIPQIASRSNHEHVSGHHNQDQDEDGDGESGNSNSSHTTSTRRLSGIQWEVYRLICTNFLASLGEVCTYYQTEINLEMGMKVFPEPFVQADGDVDGDGDGDPDTIHNLCEDVSDSLSLKMKIESPQLQLQLRSNSQSDSIQQPTLVESEMPEMFSIQTTMLLKAGWTEIQPSMTPKSSPPIDVDVNDWIPVKRLSILQSKTSPPPLLSESDLIQLMETHGIGTDASIATHIANVIERGYVQLTSESDQNETFTGFPSSKPKKFLTHVEAGGEESQQSRGRRLIPTTLGTALIHGYRQVDPDLCLPTMRARFEAQLSLIASGKAYPEDVLLHMLLIYRAKYLYLLSKISRVDALFQIHFTPMKEAPGEAFSKCGNCHKTMMKLTSRPQRLVCTWCQESYLIPDKGIVKKLAGKECPYDNFELCLFTIPGDEGIMYIFCPCCYNNPPDDGIPNGMSCAKCPHPSCEFSPARTAIRSCPNEKVCTGILVLQPYTRPVWRLICSHCNYMIYLARDAYNITLVLEGDEQNEYLEDDPEYQEKHLSPIAEPSVRINKKSLAASQSKSTNPLKRARKLEQGGPLATCGGCHSRLLRFNFNRNNTPFVDGRTTYTGCLFCDPFLASLATPVYGQTTFDPRKSSQGARLSDSGRGRGGGRGRGRGRK